MPPTLLLPPRFSNDSIAMAQAAVSAGWSTHRFDSWRVADSFACPEPVFYGEPLFALALGQQLPLRLIEPRLDWLAELPRRIVGRTVRFMTLNEARSIATPAFFKPADDKSFKAAVYASGANIPTFPAPTTPVLVSDIVRFRVEYRLFVAERRIAASSIYLRDGVLAEGDGTWPAPAGEHAAAIAFGRSVLEDGAIALPPGLTLDVGLLDDGCWAVIEANPAWGAGIYGCPPAEVLPVLRRTAQLLGRISTEDAKWIVHGTVK